MIAGSKFLDMESKQSFGAAIVLSVLALQACNGSRAEESSSMEVSSPAFGSNDMIPAEFTCDGANRSPPLQWTDPPSGTGSFAVVLEDPDAPSGTFRHWGAYNIPGEARQLKTGAGNQNQSDFQQAENDFGEVGYGGPCPPPEHGAHRYRFRLLALDTEELRFESTPTVTQVLERAEPHVVASSVLTAQYERR